MTITVKPLTIIVLFVQALHGLFFVGLLVGGTFVTINCGADGTMHALLGSAPQEVVALGTPSGMMERLFFEVMHFALPRAVDTVSIIMSTIRANNAIASIAMEALLFDALQKGSAIITPVWLLERSQMEIVAVLMDVIVVKLALTLETQMLHMSSGQTPHLHFLVVVIPTVLMFGAEPEMRQEVIEESRCHAPRERILPKIDGNDYGHSDLQ